MSALRQVFRTLRALFASCVAMTTTCTSTSPTGVISGSELLAQIEGKAATPTGEPVR
jgi:hypothetical protein